MTVTEAQKLYETAIRLVRVYAEEMPFFDADGDPHDVHGLAFEALLELERRGIDAHLTVCGCVPPDRFRHPRMHVIPFLDKNVKAQRERFVEGAVKRGYPPKKIERIFDLLAKFAEYGFPKAHSAAYALLAYHTAYLKTHYPVEFMAALLTSVTGSTDDVVKYINECREMGIAVESPDINVSDANFTDAGCPASGAPSGTSNPVSVNPSSIASLSHGSMTTATGTATGLTKNSCNTATVTCEIVGSVDPANTSQRKKITATAQDTCETCSVPDPGCLARCP